MVFHHASYRVRCLTAEVTFLGKLFETSVDHRFVNDVGDTYGYMLRITEQIALEIFLTDAAQPVFFSHIAFKHPDLATFRAELEELGLAPSNIAVGRTDRVAQFFIRSPGGLTLEFHQT